MTHLTPRCRGRRCAAGLLTLAAACSWLHPSDETPPPVVAAVVGTSPIYLYQLKRELSRYQSEALERTSQVTLAKALLDDMVLERVLLDEARRKGIEISAEEVTEARQRIAGGYRPGELHQLLHRNHMTPEVLEERLADHLRIERLIEAQIGPTEPPSEEALREYYAANPLRFEVPAQVRARQILVQTREEAEELRTRAKRGEPFERLARNYSLAPEASKGGDLGFFGRGVMPPVFDQVCFTLQPGEISDVVASEYGFHLFQVLEARPAETTSFEEARDQLMRDLTDRARQAAAERLVAQLREKAQVTIHVEALTSLFGDAGAS